MSEYDIVIKGGTVVNASDTVKADVGIKDERIVAIAENLTGGDMVIDATGRYVMPGGIDSHCHIEQPSSAGGVNAESFEGGHQVGSLWWHHLDHLFRGPVQRPTDLGAGGGLS